MNFVLKPWQFALIVIAGWMHREQPRVNGRSVQFTKGPPKYRWLDAD
jgi:hypothetical protein